MTRSALKTQNTPLIWTVVAADALASVAFAFPSFTDQAASLLTGARLAGVSIAPVVVLLLTSILPANLKAVLVYWRVRDVLPGHRAFSVYAINDSRVDVARLRAIVGEFPTAPRDQNTLWYRLFKKVDGDPGVAQTHRHFLLFRDLAALSLVLTMAAPVGLLAAGSGSTAAVIAAALFGCQYAATAIAARFSGVRLICNVLALTAAGEQPTRPMRKRSERAGSGLEGSKA